MFERITRLFSGTKKQDSAASTSPVLETREAYSTYSASAIKHDRKVVHDSRIFVHHSLGFILAAYPPEAVKKAVNHEIVLGYIYGYIIAAISDDEELYNASDDRKWEVIAAYYRIVFDFAAEEFYMKTTKSMEKEHFKNTTKVSAMDYYKNKENPYGDNHHLKYLMIEIIEGRV